MTDLNRCRLVLILTAIDEEGSALKGLADALRGGDVASVILSQGALDEKTFQKRLEPLVRVAQEAGAAVLIHGDSRVAGRVQADGLHVIGPLEAMAEAVEKHQPKLIVGGGQAQDRHQALELGDLRPDYVFFGKLDGDIKPEPHPKNLALAEWWASMIEIPCVVMGGTALDSVLAVAETGAEFVALASAVFAAPQGPAVAVAEINALLDEKAPRFED